MAEHNRLGALGEEVACRYLSSLDYRLLERNWRGGHLEVDIIADNYGELVFVEVKTRSREGEFTALGAVDVHKQRNLAVAAEAYMQEHYLNCSYRFDVITVVGEQEPFEVTHYVDAYFVDLTRRKRYIHRFY